MSSIEIRKIGITKLDSWIADSVADGHMAVLVDALLER